MPDEGQAVGLAEAGSTTMDVKESVAERLRKMEVVEGVVDW